MKFIILIYTLAITCIGEICGSPALFDLSGEWRFQPDQNDKGCVEKWFSRRLPERILLPDALQNQGFGNDIDSKTPWMTGERGKGNWYTHPLYEEFRKKENVRYINNFQPKKHYVGAAWYQRDFTVDRLNQGERVILKLERVHWESQLWIDNQFIGKNRSLLAPHSFDITKFIVPGKKQTITLRIDNREIVQIGLNAHSFGDQTMTAWNGIVGNMELEIKPIVCLDQTTIHPDLKHKKARLVYSIRNGYPEEKKVQLSFEAKSTNTGITHKTDRQFLEIILSPGKNTIEATLALGDGMLEWDEYSPAVYQLHSELSGEGVNTSLADTFGMREISTSNNRFILNDREIYLRGNLICGSFPLTGYASMETHDWLRIMTVLKDHGVNHIRFHSWTPPRAAFMAADQLGMYLMCELGFWTRIHTDDQKAFLDEEGESCLGYLGNHPSFIMMGMGNELSARKEITNYLLTKWKNDKRRLYTGLASSLGSMTSLYDFTITGHLRSNKGWPPKPKSSYFYNNRPSSNFIFHDPVQYEFPMISHEVGQHCSYPDVSRTRKFSGSQYPAYLDVAWSQLSGNGLLDQSADFVHDSGKLQAAFYKNEIESYRRTPRHTGYQILQLEDFPGQGGAPVGVLDYFYDSKGYISPSEFEYFNGDKVLLCEMKQFVWLNSETFQAKTLVSNWGPNDMKAESVSFKLTDQKGNLLAEKNFPAQHIVRGDPHILGKFSCSLSSIQTPQAITLEATSYPHGLKNKWNIWVYPALSGKTVPDDIPLVTTWDDETAARVRQGGTVIFQIPDSQVRGATHPCFLPVYWTQFDNHGGSQTMGITCNPKHPLFSLFPTDSHTNWQWWDILKDTKPIIFDERGMKHSWAKGFKPLIQIIDGWKTNRKLGVMAEARFGQGKIIITSINFTDDMENRPATRQLLHSLVHYVQSEDFNPSTCASVEQISSLLTQKTNASAAVRNPLIQSITCDSHEEGMNPSLMIDGKPDTFWHSAYTKEKKSLPSSIIIKLKKTENIGAIKYTPRQDQQSGRIKECEVYLSMDGKNWGDPIHKEKLNLAASLCEMGLQYFHPALFIKIKILETANPPHAAIGELDLITN